MKKILVIIVCFIFSFFLIISTSKADSCSYKEQQALNKEAVNIKKGYEIIYQDLPEGYTPYANGILDSNGNDVTDEFNDYFTGYYIKIHLSNITENMYLDIEGAKLYTSTDEVIERINYSDTNQGTIELSLYDTNTTHDIKFSIYATTQNCNEKKLLKTTLTTPRYNNLSSLAICDDIPDYKYCQNFIKSNAKTAALEKEIMNYKNSLNKKETVKEEKNNWLITVLKIFGGVLIIAIIIFAGLWIKRFLERRKHL